MAEAMLLCGLWVGEGGGKGAWREGGTEGGRERKKHVFYQTLNPEAAPRPVSDSSAVLNVCSHQGPWRQVRS